MLSTYPYFSGEGRSELFVQVNDDPQAHKNVLFILHLKEEEHGKEKSLDMSLEVVIGREAMDQLQDKFTKLLYTF